MKYIITVYISNTEVDPGALSLELRLRWLGYGSIINVPRYLAEVNSKPPLKKETLP